MLSCEIPWCWLATAVLLSVPWHALRAEQVQQWITASTNRNSSVSPDGRKLVFQSDRSGLRALHISSSDGENVTLFLGSGEKPRYADWSPDGRQITTVDWHHRQAVPDRQG